MGRCQRAAPGNRFAAGALWRTAASRVGHDAISIAPSLFLPVRQNARRLGHCRYRRRALAYPAWISTPASPNGPRMPVRRISGPLGLAAAQLLATTDTNVHPQAETGDE